MSEKRRGNRPSHFPLTIDPLGGVSMANFSLRGEGGLGILEDILISGVDLAALAGTKMALERGDWGNIEDLKQSVEDRLINLKFTPEDLQLVIVDVAGREVVGAEPEDENNLGADEFGFLPGKANYSWTGDLGFLAGRVGFEVFPDKVIFFYGQQNVMEVPRAVSGVANFDWKVTQGMPSEDDLLNFMEEVYLPLL